MVIGVALCGVPSGVAVAGVAVVMGLMGTVLVGIGPTCGGGVPCGDCVGTGVGTGVGAGVGVDVGVGVGVVVGVWDGSADLEGFKRCSDNSLVICV